MNFSELPLVNLNATIFPISELENFPITEDRKLEIDPIECYLTGSTITQLDVLVTYYEMKQVIGFQYRCDVGQSPIFFHPFECIQYLQLMLNSDRRVCMDSTTMQQTQEVIISPRTRSGLFILVTEKEYEHYTADRLRLDTKIWSISTETEYKALDNIAKLENKKIVRVSLAMWRDADCW